jgi:hypothetical protein
VDIRQLGRESVDAHASEDALQLTVATHRAHLPATGVAPKLTTTDGMGPPQELSLNYHVKCEQFARFAAGGFLNFNGSPTRQVFAWNPGTASPSTHRWPTATLTACARELPLWGCHEAREKTKVKRGRVLTRTQARRGYGGARASSTRATGTTARRWRTWTCRCAHTYVAGGSSSSTTWR